MLMISTTRKPAPPMEAWTSQLAMSKPSSVKTQVAAVVLATDSSEPRRIIAPKARAASRSRALRSTYERMSFGRPKRLRTAVRE